MREAGDAGRTEAEIVRLQRWRRDHNVMWLFEMSRADDSTLRGRFMTDLAARARRCEPDAIWLCNIAFGRGRGPGNQSGRPRVGLPTPAAWDTIGIGSYVWCDGALGRVRAKGHADATITVFTADAAPRRITVRTNVKFTMSRSDVVHYDSLPLLVDTASPTTSGCVHVRHHEDGSQPIPTLLAYSDGSVTANGALGSAAAMLRIGLERRLRDCADRFGGHSALLWALGVDGAAAGPVHRQARP